MKIVKIVYFRDVNVIGGKAFIPKSVSFYKLSISLMSRHMKGVKVTSAMIFKFIIYTHIVFLRTRDRRVSLSVSCIFCVYYIVMKPFPNSLAPRLFSPDKERQRLQNHQIRPIHSSYLCFLSRLLQA